ncbi:TetR family transcriptional regulator C-terminal domain-containing protein [Embleya sp. MST-111070]|uniref:TetR family transcriptional regulator C-terminal domain-containing protein n=1 Tax=Embleya sp. MST-111070 TaxID=3398231 RepID=UPI003F734CD4
MAAFVAAARVDRRRTRAAVAAILRANARVADADGPAGCMIVVAATNCTDANAPVRDLLATRRDEGLRDLRLRLDCGVRDGDLPPDTDTEAVAAYYTAVNQGLSFRARDAQPPCNRRATGWAGCPRRAVRVARVLQPRR